MPAMSTPPIKQIVHISRYWDNPEIKVAVHREGITIEISLEDFCRAVAQEVGSPTFLFKNETLQQRIVDAISPVLEKVKEASNFI